MANVIGDRFLAKQWERRYFADECRFCPPPWFIPLIVLLEVAVFIYFAIESGTITETIYLNQLARDSILIYRSDFREEIWRYFTYMFIHVNLIHLLFNLTFQVILGVPLEVVHGSLRIAIIYMTGVLAGSLATSVFDAKAMLVGSSGGVYALLAGHLANVILNYNEMKWGPLRIVLIFLAASIDFGYAIYDRYSSNETYYGYKSSVSFVAHIAGALAGLTIGLVVLKNFEQKLRHQLIWWISLGAYISLIVFAILFNIFYPPY